MRILIVDDDPHIRGTMQIALETIGHSTGLATRPSEALRLIDGDDWDLALVDIKLGTESGLELLDVLSRIRPRTAVVIITAHTTIDLAVDAMRRGAVDFLPKPFTPAQLRAVIERAGRLRGLNNRLADLEQQVRSEIPEIALESRDPDVGKVLEMARRVASTEAVVLLRGESGTGKGVLARRIHGWSRRAEGPFVTVSCPSLNADLLESELFGHVRGAFTGAIKDTEGKVAVAAGGTLFLDEVGDLPSALQPKLLRFLQERRYERVGDARTRVGDVRLIAATNRDLTAEVAAGRFREDLYYRLNVVELSLIPLRSRIDVPELATHLLEFFAQNTGRKLLAFSEAALRAISSYSWPGNLRELRNAIERAAIFASGEVIELEDLPDRVAATHTPSTDTTVSVEVGRPVTLEQLEAEHIRRILLSTPTRDDAARVLGIDPSTLYRKRKALGL